MVDETHHEFTKGGRQKKPSITQWCHWVLQAWADIDSAIIIKSFKKCSISNALDGTEDNTLYEDSSEGDTDSDPYDDIAEEIPYDDKS